MKTFLILTLGILPMITFAQFPSPENFEYTYDYIMIDEWGTCGEEYLQGPTYCSYFEWNTPDTFELSTILELYNIYVLDSYSGNTNIIASITDTTYHVEMGIVGEIWVTAVYSNPEGESAPSNVELNSDLPMSIDNNNENNKIRIDYDKSFEIITFNHAEFIKKVSFFDVNGRLVKSINNTINTINLSDLTPGLYIIEIVGENYIRREKIIK